MKRSSTRASVLMLLVAVLLPTPLCAQFRLKQSTASQEVPLGYFTDSVDGDTAETGLTIANTDIKLWKEGATSVVSKNSGGATHMSGGIYYCVLDATDTNTVGNLRIYCHPTGAGPFWIDCLVQPAAVYDAERGGAYGSVLLRSTVSSVASQTHLTLNTAILSDNMIGCRFVVRRASTGQVITGTVSDTSSGEEIYLTVDGTADYTIVNGDTVEVMPPGFSVAKLLATTNGAASVATQLSKLDAAVSTAGGGILYSSTVASVTSQTNLTLNSALLSDNLIGCRIVIRRNSSGQVITGTVTDTTSGEEVTFAVDGTADYTIANGDTVQIIPPGFSIDRMLAKVNGATSLAAQWQNLDAAVSTAASASADTRDLEPVQFTWKLNRRADGTIESTNTLVLGPGESFRCGFECAETNALPIGTVMGTMSVPTSSNAAASATKLGIDPTMAKVQVTADSEATAGAKGYIRTTITNNHGAGPVTLLGKFVIAEEPE